MGRSPSRCTFFHSSFRPTCSHTIFQFHFATVLSPWIRRALIAGGFGVGASRSSTPTEIAQVVSLGDVRNTANIGEKTTDIEGIAVAEELRKGGADSPDSADDAPIDLEDTPFFHFDVVSAVRAAEAGLARQDSRSSTGKWSDSGKRPVSTAVTSLVGSS